MIGVVVWSSEDRQKAVIWCEDQGALAYLKDGDDLQRGAEWPAAGDLMELESETIGELRFARCVSPIRERSCPEIPTMLQAMRPSEPGLRLVSSEGRAVSDRQATRAKGQTIARRVACNG